MAEAGLTRCVPPAAGRDAGGAAVGADGDVPRERPLGGRSHFRPVADGSAKDVQVRERRGGPESFGSGSCELPGRCGAGPVAALIAGRAVRGGQGAAGPRPFFLGGVSKSGWGRREEGATPGLGGGTGGKLLSEAWKHRRCLVPIRSI